VLRSYLRVSDLTPRDLALLLDLAADYKSSRARRGLLEGESVVLYFNKPSTRTRISFETAIARLGGAPITVGPNDLQMGRGETIEDTARVISRYARAYVTRTFADADVRRFAAAASIPVVNALTDGHHPCQALADLLTVREHLGGLEGKTLTYVGAGNNVAHSLMEACALAGMHVRVAVPAKYPVDAEVIERSTAMARATGATVTVLDDVRAGVHGADIVYTDTWLSMGDPPEERETRLRDLWPYRVDDALMALAAPGARFMHCLPAHRGEEVTDEVADSRASVIFDQAENKLHTAIAVLDALLERKLEGSGLAP
jgi:ornithine carbamoyltransferase